MLAGNLASAREEIDGTGSSAEEEPGRSVYAYQRAVAVYGMINLRTDGERVVMAQKLEREAPSGAQWDHHCLRPVNGTLTYVGDDR